MPSPWYPDYEKFKKEFEKYSVNENTILIGHSCGSSFLVRWLGETKRKIFKLILFTPWKVHQKVEIFINNLISLNI
jgi:predicted alpha/beta hydrolase family esterase